MFRIRPGMPPPKPNPDEWVSGSGSQMIIEINMNIIDIYVYVYVYREFRVRSVCGLYCLWYKIIILIKWSSKH